MKAIYDEKIKRWKIPATTVFGKDAVLLAKQMGMADDIDETSNIEIELGEVLLDSEEEAKTINILSEMTRDATDG